MAETTTLDIYVHDENGSVSPQQRSPSTSPASSPQLVQRGHRGSAFLDMNGFLTNRGTRVNTPTATSPSSTVPNSPQPPFESPAPTLPSSPVQDADEDDSAEPPEIRFHGMSDVFFGTPEHKTPSNTKTQNTPATSKRATTKELFGGDQDIDQIPRSSLIVPVLIPDAFGTFAERRENDRGNDQQPAADDEWNPKLVLCYGVLVTEYAKAFPRDDKTAQTDANKRRSITFVNTRNSGMLMIDQHVHQNRTRSADHEIRVKLLLATSHLENCPRLCVDGKAMGAILKATASSLSRKAIPYSDTSYFQQNFFIPCHGISTVSSRCVRPPLRTTNGTFITVSAYNNILEHMYVKHWPDGDPRICWYDDGRDNEIHRPHSSLSKTRSLREEDRVRS